MGDGSPLAGWGAAFGFPKFVQTMLEVPYWIGLIVQEWSKLERILAAVISWLEDRPYSVVKSEVLDLPAVEQRRRLENALVAAESDIKSAGLEAAGELGRLRALRHDIIHGWWSGLNEQKEFVLSRKDRGEVAERRREMSAAELRIIHGDLQELGATLAQLQRRLEGVSRGK